MRTFCAWCSVGCNEMGTFDLLVGLANDHGTMKDRSQDEQALIRIQHDWAEARVKGDSSFTRRRGGRLHDCLSRRQNREQTSRFANGDRQHRFQRIQDQRSASARLWRNGNRSRSGTISAQKGQQNLLAGKFVWTNAFVKQGGEWKVVASQITPVLER
jgi:hypothetical protein